MDLDELERRIGEYVEWAVEHPEERAAQAEIELAEAELSDGADPWELIAFSEGEQL